MAFIKETTAEDWCISINRKTRTEKAKCTEGVAERERTSTVLILIEAIKMNCFRLVMFPSIVHFILFYFRLRLK